MSRREFLRRAGATGLALPSLAALVEACSSSPSGGGGGGGGGGASQNPYGVGGIAGAPYPLARPNAPVTWNLTADNPAIKSGLSPESGPLRIFGYNDYIYKKVLNAFEQKYNTKIQYSVFATPDEMVAKVQADPSAYDIIVTVTTDNVGKMIAGKLVQPLNHSYLTNFTTIWPSLQDPYYDKGSRYSIPYTVYTTGIAWRNDLVKDDIAAMPNPYEMLWDTKYTNKVHVLNGSRDLVALGLLRNGVSDVNTTSQSQLNAAKQILVQGVQSMNWKFDHTDYNELTVAGSWYLHETWSGQVAYYQYYLPKGLSIDKFSYTWPPKDPGKRPGLLSNDIFMITKGASNPVLAHALIDMLLTEKYAISNYGYEGYQPPLNFIQPDRIVAQGLVPKNLANIIISDSDFPLGVAELEIPPQATQQYQQIYQQVTGGAGGA